jgi:hypothetical protein
MEHISLQGILIAVSSAALVLLASACTADEEPVEAGEQGTQTVLFADDFSDECKWAEVDDETASLACADGSYRIATSDRGGPATSWNRSPSDVSALAVEADVIIADQSGVVGGIGCWGQSEEVVRGYVFVVDVSGSWAILRRDDEESPNVTSLAEGETDRVVAGEQTRLRGACVGGDGSTSVAMFIDDYLIAAVEDEDPVRSFGHFGFFAATGDIGGEGVRFDDFAASEPSLEDARAVRAAVGGAGMLPLEDDFSDPASGWTRDESAESSFRDGSYRVATTTSTAWGSSRFFAPAHDAVELEVDVRVRSGPDVLSFGLSCRTAEGHGYTVAITQGGDYAIFRELGSQQELVSSGQDPAAAGGALRLGMACVGDGKKPATITVYADGSEVAKATDVVEGVGPFEEIGLYVQSDRRAEVLFDDFAARPLR